jgi:hypothetical protein
MSRIKDHYHDEIVAQFEESDAQRVAAEEQFYSPIPMPPVHVLVERNEITGEIKPVQVYTVLSDAQDDLRLLRLGRRLFRLPENQTHHLVENVPCL